ncbi:hypothetical protein RUND412_002942 [Rhizina undulata]
MDYAHYQNAPFYPQHYEGGMPPREFVAEAPAPPISHFNSPNIEYAQPSPASPYVVPVSPAVSVAPSRDTSRHRRSLGPESFIQVHDGRNERLYRGAGHLSVAGSSSLARSNSERSRPPVYVEVAGSRGRNGPGRGAGGPSYYYDTVPRNQGKMYIEGGSGWGGSACSGSSFESRSRSRSRRRASRSPSLESYDSRGEEYPSNAVGYPRVSREDHLSKQLAEVKAQLAQVHEAEEKRRLEAEAAKMEKLRNEEIERKVAEQLELRKRKEVEEAAALAKKEEDEKKRIEHAARKLLEEQAKAAADKKAAEEAERARIQAMIDAADKQKTANEKGKKTYTKFSKVHLCKEALDERGIEYTEEVDHFLVHKYVEKPEQNYLWGRTKEIRNYYQQIQEAAAKAPTVPGPNGGFVKYVQIAGQPYPIALPVTITQTPGGGQTQKVDPIKIKWSDIFRPTKF